MDKFLTPVAAQRRYQAANAARRAAEEAAYQQAGVDAHARLEAEAQARLWAPGGAGYRFLAGREEERMRSYAHATGLRFS